MTRYPWRSNARALLSTGKSSILLVIRWRPFFSANAIITPLIAMLLDSVLPEVKMNSLGWPPNSAAKAERASSSASRAVMPMEYPNSEVATA